MDSDWKKEISSEIKVFAKWIASCLIDAIFLVFWVFAQWTANNIIASLKLSAIDVWVFSAFQLLFAVSTLAPIVIYIYVDIRVMILRAQRRIRHEIELG